MVQGLNLEGLSNVVPAGSLPLSVYTTKGMIVAYSCPTVSNAGLMSTHLHSSVVSVLSS